MYPNRQILKMVGMILLGLGIVFSSLLNLRMAGAQLSTQVIALTTQLRETAPLDLNCPPHLDRGEQRVLDASVTNRGQSGTFNLSMVAFEGESVERLALCEEQQVIESGQTVTFSCPVAAQDMRDMHIQAIAFDPVNLQEYSGVCSIYVGTLPLAESPLIPVIVVLVGIGLTLYGGWPLRPFSLPALLIVFSLLMLAGPLLWLANSTATLSASIVGMTACPVAVITVLVFAFLGFFPGRFKRRAGPEKPPITEPEDNV